MGTLVHPGAKEAARGEGLWAVPLALSRHCQLCKGEQLRSDRRERRVGSNDQRDGRHALTRIVLYRPQRLGGKLCSACLKRHG